MEERQGAYGGLQWVGLIAGPLLAAGTYALMPGSYPGGQGEVVVFSHAGRVTAALAVWMAVWWLTEAISLYATSLLPLAVLPVTGAMPLQRTAAPYAHELIFLFMGGFIIALAMQRWGLHRRFALLSLRLAGDSPRRIVGCFMGVTAFISMWVSNTATAIMMLPIALSVLELLKDHQSAEAMDPASKQHFATGLMLGIAYAASIGGVGTLIGTPPNLFLASYTRSSLGQEISFVRWMGLGVPLVVLFLPVTWLLLTRLLYPIRMDRLAGSETLVREAYARLGRMSAGEWVVLTVFLGTAAAWISQPYLTAIEIGGIRPLGGLTDTGIAMIAVMALFVIPVDIEQRTFAMDWQSAAGLPWGTLVLFGGGLSLAAAIQANGVDELIGHQVRGLAGLPSLLIVVAVTTMVIFLTELTSNTATAATMVPILASVAAAMGVHPFLLIVPATIAASLGFMLPVGTPPNAIVFGSGYVTMRQMCRAGLWLDLLGVAVITLLAYTLLRPLLIGG